MYRLISISLQLQGKSILQSVSLNIIPGRFTALLGANGAGKSSLLKILSGASRPDGGEVMLDEQPLRHYTQQALALRRAVLSQQTLVQFPYTAKEIVLLGCHPLRSSPLEKERLALLELAAVGMQAQAAQNFLTLSGGEQQRVQLARVMAQISHHSTAGKYLLLDEPAASLDMGSQQLIFSKVKALCQQGVGVLAVIHDINLAIRFADHFVLLKDGQKTAEGDRVTVIHPHTLEHTFGYPVRLLHDDVTELPVVVPAQHSSTIISHQEQYKSVHHG